MLELLRSARKAFNGEFSCSQLLDMKVRILSKSVVIQASVVRRNLHQLGRNIELFASSPLFNSTIANTANTATAPVIALLF